MNNHDYFGNRHDDRLGVNKIGKSIRKSPPHQPNFASQARQPPQPPQPQVYNINKNDFRNIVQQLTGSPLHHSQQPLPRPPVNPSNNNPSNRLQKIRPPSLAPININRPQLAPVQPGQYSQPPRPGVPLNNTHGARPTQYGQPRAPQADSPISAYMRHLQHSIIDPTQNHPQAHPSFPSPRMIGPPTTRPFIPQSPTSQFVLPSPSGYMNLLSPLSQNPLLSPGYQQFPPLTPNFSFSPMGQPGIWGPGPQPPASPGMGFPSPGFFNLSSPRWRN